MKLKPILSECWTGYKQVGLKNKGGRQVPNCVPESVIETVSKNDIEKLTQSKDLDKFFKANKNKLDKKYIDDIEGEIGALKYLESDYKRGDVDWEEVLIAIEEVQDLIKKSLKIKETIKESSKDDIIKDLDKVRTDLIKKVDVLIAKKKKLYSDVDITTPMSADEKQLDKDIQSVFSQIQQIIQQKRSLKESELKGYLAADVVDDIVKSISSKFIKGYVEDAPNRNYIYLKLTDKKFADDVIKALKSKFGIIGKYDKTFGYMPSVSFPSNKVISEAQAVSGGKVHKLITGKNLKFKGKSYNQIDFETLGIDNSNGTIRLRILAPKEIFGNEMSLDFKTIRRSPFFKTDTSNQLGEGLYYVGYNKGRGQGTGVFKDSYSSYKDAKKEVEKIEKQRGGSYNMVAYYVSDKDGNFVKESVNEEKVYIDYLNKQKGFKQDRIKFNSYEEAVKWARKNFEKFSPDMIKYESVNEISSNVPKIFVKTAAVEKKIKELMADRKRAVVPYNKETDPKKKEILKQILIKLTSQIKGYEKNLIQLRDMEEEYIQQMNADAELEVESKN